MHQRLMFGMLLYGGIVAIIALRLIWLAAFGDHAGHKGGLVSLTPETWRHRRPRRSYACRTIDAWIVGLQPGKVIGDKLDLARKLAQLMPEKDEAAYLQMLRSGRSFYYLRRRASHGTVAAINARANRAWRCSASPTGSTRS